MTVLVSGATGSTGSEVARQLQTAGVPVRALTRSETSAGALRAAGLEAVVADLADPGTLPAALAGIDAVYVANPASEALAAHEGALARAAADAGVAHLVKLSVIGCAPDSPLTFARVHAAAEEAVREAGVPWTMVRPNGFMQNTLAWAAQLPSGVVRGPVLDARWSIVDVRDVAAVAVAALLDPADHAGAAHEVTGPVASSPREQIATLADVLGRELVAEEVTVDATVATLLEAGWPRWNAEGMGELLRLYADGLADHVSPAVAEVLGRPARGYAAFARDHRTAFTG